MPEPIRIQGRDYYVNLDIISGSTASGDVNLVIELYEEEPTFTSDVASVEPVESIQCYGDAESLYHQFKDALKVLNATRSH